MGNGSSSEFSTSIPPELQELSRCSSTSQTNSPTSSTYGSNGNLSHFAADGTTSSHLDYEEHKNVIDGHNVFYSNEDSYSNVEVTISLTNFLKDEIELKRSNVQFSSSSDQEEHLQETYSRSEQHVFHTSKRIYIFTISSIPNEWSTYSMTPLLRAMYLSKETNKKITLVLPWLENPHDQVKVYGEYMFYSSIDQEQYIKNWLSKNFSGDAEKLDFVFYKAKYHSEFKSIFAIEDILLCISNNDRYYSYHKNDICILEEPEHLNWFRAPHQQRWQEKFAYVIGIVHTDYRLVDKNNCTSSTRAILNCQSYCDSIITPSKDCFNQQQEQEQQFRNEQETEANSNNVLICNLNCVHKTHFSNTNIPMTSSDKESNPYNVYFMEEELSWDAMEQILQFQIQYKKSTGKYFPTTIYYQEQTKESHDIHIIFVEKIRFHQMSIPDHIQALLKKIKVSALSIQFLQEQRHIFNKQLKLKLLHKNEAIFINPDMTQMFSSKTNEAIAMSKFVILPFSSTNDLQWKEFPNVLLYRNEVEFSHCVRYALEHAPIQLTNELQYQLTWEAATKRFISLF